MICMFKVIHYCLQIYLKTLETSVYELDPAHFLSAPGLAWQACSTKTKVKLLTNNNILLRFEKGTRDGICQAIQRDAKANNKYMKNYDKRYGQKIYFYIKKTS